MTNERFPYQKIGWFWRIFYSLFAAICIVEVLLIWFGGYEPSRMNTAAIFLVAALLAVGVAIRGER